MAGKQFSVEKFMRTLELVSESDTSSEVRRISLDQIDENPLNFYPAIDGAAMTELMDSIQANGLLEPLTVLADGGRYRLVSGHNRLTACAACGTGWGMGSRRMSCAGSCRP